jgi:hypothetical protein
MNHDTQRFSELLSQLRDMGKTTQRDACRTLGIGHPMYAMLRAELRRERGELTYREQLAVNIAKVDAFIGDRDPMNVTRREISVACGISDDWARSTRSAVVQNRLAAAQAAKPKRRKVDWLFRVEGARLFSMNREPAEVGG